jgi:hypothetical protein
VTASLVALTLALGGAAASPSPEALWELWPSARFVTTPAPCLRHEELVERIGELEARHPDRLSVEEVGRSVEGRPILLLRLGTGPRRVLLWSQMHGDEPSATPALVDMASFLLSRPASATATLLERVTLLLVPMLNPDGAEHYVRRNAQAIDINRDALQLTTPEGRVLKALRDRFEPELGFNLHDQNRRTTVGATGRLATISLLAVAGDEAGTMTPGRARAKRACSAIARALAPFVPGGIARYDEDWNPRAFGDNLTGWGTPVVLIESGGMPPGWTYPQLTRLNFVALLSALFALAADDLAGEDPEVYESLGRNRNHMWVDVLVSGGDVWQPGAGAPYRADVAFDRLDPDPLRAGCETVPAREGSRVREIGDGRFLGAGRRVDATGTLVVPALTASIWALGAREWLDEAALGALGRLGVARILWHVAPDEHADARALAEALAGPARPVLEVRDAEAEPCLLEVSGRPPAVPAPVGLDQALDALTAGRWRSAAAGRSLPGLLEPLIVCPGDGKTTRILAPDEPASLLVLRAAVAGPAASGNAAAAPRSAAKGPRADELILDAVFIDGREPPPQR